MKPKINDRIALEPLTAAHAAELFPLLCQSAIYNYIADPPPVSEEALAERYRCLESRSSPDGTQQWLNWAIRRREDRECIGFVQATIYTGGTADLAFVLGSQFWGLGLAYEVCTAALWLFFSEFGISSVFATADGGNVRSCALLLRLGFERVAPSCYPHGTPGEGDEVFRLEADYR